MDVWASLGGGVEKDAEERPVRMHLISCEGIALRRGAGSGELYGFQGFDGLGARHVVRRRANHNSLTTVLPDSLVTAVKVDIFGEPCQILLQVCVALFSSDDEVVNVDKQHCDNLPLWITKVEKALLEAALTPASVEEFPLEIEVPCAATTLVP